MRVNLQAQTQDGIKGELLKSLQEETVKSITRKVCDTVCELAAGIYEEGKWPELLPFLFQCVTAGSEPLKEASLNIFAQLAEYIGESLVPHLATLHGILGRVRTRITRTSTCTNSRSCIRPPT